MHWLPSSGDPWQLLNVQTFSKSYEILCGKKPDTMQLPGTQEGGAGSVGGIDAREEAPSPMSLFSCWNNFYIHPLFEAQHQENILHLCQHFFGELHVFPMG